MDPQKSVQELFNRLEELSRDIETIGNDTIFLILRDLRDEVRNIKINYMNLARFIDRYYQTE